PGGPLADPIGPRPRVYIRPDSPAGEPMDEPFPPIPPSAWPPSPSQCPPAASTCDHPIHAMPGFTPNRLRGLGLKLKIAGSVSAPLFGLAGGFAGGPLGVAIGGTLAAL